MENKEYLARTAKGLAYERAQAALISTLENPPAELRADVQAMADSFRQLALTPGAVSTTPVLQNLAVSYTNDEYIGTRILPVVNTVSDLGLSDGDLSASYWKKNKQDSFAEDGDDAVATRGAVSEIEEGFTRSDVSLTRRARKRFIDAWTDAAMAGVVRRMVNPLMTIADRLALKQERRIATIAQTSGNFGSNTTALTGSDRWTSGGGDPLGVIMSAKAALYHGGPSRVIMAMSLAVYNVLVRHPVLLDAYKYTAGGGRVTREQLATYFEVDEVLVGSAQYNSAKEGATPVYAQIWGNSVGLYRVSTLTGTDVVQFGATIETPRFQSAWFEQGAGGRGGFHTQIAFADASVIIAADAGYLITTPIG